ncbi:NAD(P)H-binding protein [Allonocardiopsis opalescens]|uniref:Uncharacterized protein YbjT (DUF2867 family) n=1 Tax=Allonocardiopsis opalescens TaxID=1144618 RepID=A0A2T0PX58_9ACTN|nr:NAD(P)H-binding protein [Allonocardiopsis opalescens]PRX96111.1 uncharacterized protein YbjT (DUF2867 family) [Allonocardiopsis opalescens]
MEKTRTLVTGGTGKTGRRVVDGLRALGVPVRAASRSGDTRFDWADPGGWDAALDGADAVYIVPLDGAPTTRPFVERAVRAGVRRLVLLSARGVATPGYFADDDPVARTHRDGEQAVRESGLDWTILRPGWFADNFSEGLFRPGVLGGELALPAGDGAAAWIDARDIADVAVAALTGEGHGGRVYELSGPRPLTVDGALAEIARAGGPRARYVPVAAEDFVAAAAAQGVPPEEATAWAAAIGSIRRGLEAAPTEGVRRALGRPARDFADYAAAAQAAGAWRD